MKEHSRSQGDIPAVFRLDALKSVDLFDISLETLQRHLEERAFSSVDNTEFCLERIRQVRFPFTRP